MYDPRTIAEYERLLEPGESFLLLSDWTWNQDVWIEDRYFLNTYVPGRWVNVLASGTIGLTEQHMYFAQFLEAKKGVFKFKAGYHEVANHWARHYQNFTQWQFNRIKSNKGVLTGYSFMFAGNDGLPNSTIFNNDPSIAEKFQEIFLAGVNRYHTIASTPDFAEQLAALGRLFQEGVLTEEEFQRSKELFIGKSPDAQQQTERNLRSLKQLRDSGVLTEAEFATKKWDLLSD
jgi:hypothetical protein